MSVLGEAFVAIRPDVGKFATEASAEIKGKLKEVETAASGHFQTIAKVGAAAFGGLAIAAGGFAVESIKAALEGQKAHAQLANAVKNTGVSFESVHKPVEELSGRMAKLGYANDQVESSLARMTQITGNAEQSISLMGTAANLAAARHIDLETATTLVGRAAEGQTTMLKRLLPNINLAAGGAVVMAKAQAGVTKANENLVAVQEKVNSGHLKGTAAAAALAKAHDAVTAANEKLAKAGSAGEVAIGALNARFGGAAQANANTFVGKMAAMHAEFHNMQETIGNKLLPVITSFMGEISESVNWLEKHRGVAIALGAVIGGLLVAATIAWTVTLFTAGGALAFLISPITLVVAGVALLAAGVIYAYNHWQGFHDVVQAVAGFLTGTVVPAFQAVIGWVEKHKAVVELLGVALGTLILGPFVAVIAGLIELKAHWETVSNDIRAIVLRVWNSELGTIIRAAITVIKDVVQTGIDEVRTVVRVVMDLLRGDWGKAWNDLKNGVGQVFIDLGHLVGDYLRGIKDVAVGAVVGFGHLLWDAGKALIQGLIDGIKSAPGAVGSAIKSLIPTSIAGVHIPGLAAGGVAHGLTLVGERGPELINVGNPSMVFPTDQLSAALAGIGGGGGGYDGPLVGQILVDIDVHGPVEGTETVQMMRREAQAAVTVALQQVVRRAQQIGG